MVKLIVADGEREGVRGGGGFKRCEVSLAFWGRSVKLAQLDGEPTNPTKSDQ